MSYRRTVHCSHCGQSGHNKAGCSDYKAQIERLRGHNPDDYRVRRYDATKARRASSAQSRRCSYCGEQGHNRASCSKLKSAMEQFRALNATYRQNVFNALVENGLGPGTILSWDDWRGNSVNVMVLGIHWASVNMNNKLGSFIQGANMKLLNDIHGRGRVSARLPRSISGATRGVGIEITVRTSEMRIRAALPAGFLDGTLGLKDTFKRKDLNLHSMKTPWGDFTDVFNPNHFTTELSD